MGGKQPQQPRPAIAGLSAINFATAETDVPHPLFAGTRSLPAAWVMNPIISFTVPTSNGNGGGKGGK